MRSIGKVKIRKLKALIKEEYSRAKDPFGQVDYVALDRSINDRIPAGWFDTWESAWSEIKNIISDELNDLI